MTTDIKKAKISDWKAMGIVFLILAVFWIVIVVGHNISNTKDKLN